MKSTFLLLPFVAAMIGCQSSGLTSRHHVDTFGGKKYVNNVVNMSEHDEFPVTPKFKDDGVDLIIHRATRGSTYVDTAFARRVKETENAGVNIGAYHFALSEGFTTKGGKTLFENDPIEQARHFVKSVEKNRPPNAERVLLVFDLECYGDGEKKHISLRSACIAIEEIKRLTGVYPGLYTGSYFIKERMESPMLEKLSDKQNATSIQETLGKCWLWIARYERLPEKLPPQAPWKEWTMWQYTTNLNELKGMKVQPSDEFRHSIGGVSGEFNYFAMEKKTFPRWLAEKSWDYRYRG